MWTYCQTNYRRRATTKTKFLPSWEFLLELCNSLSQKIPFFQNPDARFLMNTVIRSILAYLQVANIGINKLYRHHSHFRTTAIFEFFKDSIRDLQMLRAWNMDMVCLPFVIRTDWDDCWIMVRVFPKLANQPTKWLLSLAIRFPVIIFPGGLVYNAPLSLFSRIQHAVLGLWGCIA